MAEIKISELEKTTDLNSQCCFPVVSEGTTKRIEYGDLMSLLKIGDVANLNTTDKSNVVAAVNEVNSKAGSSTGDTLPIGAIVEYDGTTVPEGYEEITEIGYSTTERKTGETWINGKPLYRKVVTGQITTSGTSVYPHVSTGIIDLEEIIQIDYMFGYVEERYYSNTKLNYYLDTQDNNDIVVISPSEVGKVTFIIYYTKTTD